MAFRVEASKGLQKAFRALESNLKPFKGFYRLWKS